MNIRQILLFMMFFVSTLSNAQWKMKYWRTIDANKNSNVLYNNAHGYFTEDGKKHELQCYIQPELFRPFDHYILKFFFTFRKKNDINYIKSIPKIKTNMYIIDNKENIDSLPIMMYGCGCWIEDEKKLNPASKLKELILKNDILKCYIKCCDRYIYFELKNRDFNKYKYLID